MVNIVVILGPTASGKTRLATRLASEMDAEIISADSRQVYREMNIGTGKDLGEFIVDGISIPFHLIDIKDAGDSYNVFDFQSDFSEAFNLVHSKSKMPILVGGSGMYIDSVLKDYQYTSIPINMEIRFSLEEKTDDELKAIFHGMSSSHLHQADLSTRKRTIRAIEIATYLKDNDFRPKESSEIHPIVFGLSLDADERRRKITARLHERLQNGLVEEVRSLISKGISADKLVFYGLEYKFVTEYLTGKLGYDEMVEKLNIAIHQFSKRQMTYFRKMERDGIQIHWLDAMNDASFNSKEIQKQLWKL